MLTGLILVLWPAEGRPHIPPSCWFETDKTRPNEACLDFLARTVQAWRHMPDRAIRVTGHAVEGRGAEEDARISLERARAVAQALEQLGVPMHRITVAGRRATEPFEAGRPPQAIDRRVDVFW